MVSPAQNNPTQPTLTPAQVSTQISVDILSKSLDAQKQQGADAVELIDNAAQAGPQPGDPLIAKATGMGGLLDTFA